ncbi:FtsX-like permease family protein [Actinomadura alba]|uniref:ABC transporter permease n=1 Tax=Actinomadura alba TaxID=406431 RepID=A0ABR7LIR8_9ACTN|nr:FtsX-like permease family protein [Actinomadura alba]MBC6464397.1 ABC transporter permease [Actinomadura alba]
MNISSLRAALRIARRDALRSKGRTALVVCMIGLPVLVITTLAVLIRTDAWSAAESLPYDLGRADARIEGHDRTPVLQEPNSLAGSVGGGEGALGRPWETEEVGQVVAAKFGPGARVIPMTTDGETPIRTDRGYVTAMVRELDLRDPMTRGILRITAGRAPASSGEIAISAAVRERGFRLGGSIQVDRDGERKTVVGYVEDPRVPGEMTVLSLPGVLSGGDGPHQWLATTGRPVSWADVRDLNASGLIVLSREVVRRPPAKSEIPAEIQGGSDTTGMAVIAMIIAMIVLEVVLLAGPAFAVGIGRQRRQLALVAAGGGGRGHLRVIVLGGGLVTGLGAGVLGVLAGLCVAAAAVPVIEGSTGTAMGPFEVPWSWVVATMLVGALSGLAAAYVPARQAARMNVVAALAGRREQAVTRRGWPIAGAVLIAAGFATSVLGVKVLREFGAAAGAILIIVGFVMTGPWIIGLTGRLARWLPLPMRLAVRDASRNRGRTGPVVAAIMAAVAGVTALAIAGTSDFAQQRVEYVPRLQAGSTLIQVTDAGEFQRVRQTIARELPGVPVTELFEVGGTNACGSTDDCTHVESATLGECSEANPDACIYGTSEFSFEYAVGDEAVARFILGRDDPAVMAALKAGKAVLFDPRGVRDGATVLKVVRSQQGSVEELRKVTLPAVRADAAGSAPTALLPPSAARRLGLPTTPAALLIAAADHRVTVAEGKRLDEVVAGVTDMVDIYTERGFTQSFAMPLLLLAGAGAIMVLGGSLIATGLSAADARPDLATLAAVGARPRTRRLLMMGQAGFVALLGCWLGIAAGMVPGIAVAFPLTSNDGSFGTVTGGVPEHGVMIAVPFQLLAGVGIAVPLIAMIAAGLFTRSRLPLVRRIG